MCVMILNYLDKKSMYIGLCKIPNKVLSCLVLSIVSKAACKKKKKRKKKKQQNGNFLIFSFQAKHAEKKCFFGRLERKLSFLEYANID